MTAPAYFDDSQRQATQDAGTLSLCMPSLQMKRKHRAFKKRRKKNRWHRWHLRNFAFNATTTKNRQYRQELWERTVLYPAHRRHSRILALNRMMTKNRQYRQEMWERTVSYVFELILIDTWPDGDSRCYSVAWAAAEHMVSHNDSLPSAKLRRIWDQCNLDCCCPISDIQVRSRWSLQAHEYEHGRMSLEDELSDNSNKEDAAEEQWRRREDAAMEEAYLEY